MLEDEILRGAQNDKGGAWFCYTLSLTFTYEITLAASRFTFLVSRFTFQNPVPVATHVQHRRALYVTDVADFEGEVVLLEAD